MAPPATARVDTVRRRDVAQWSAVVCLTHVYSRLSSSWCLISPPCLRAPEGWRTAVRRLRAGASTGSQVFAGSVDGLIIRPFGYVLMLFLAAGLVSCAPGICARAALSRSMWSPVSDSAGAGSTGGRTISYRGGAGNTVKHAKAGLSPGLGGCGSGPAARSTSVQPDAFHRVLDATMVPCSANTVSTRSV